MSVSQFFAMNGYAFYVWGSYGIVLLAFIVEVILVRQRRAAALQQVRALCGAGNEE